MYHSTAVTTNQPNNNETQKEVRTDQVCHFEITWNAPFNLILVIIGSKERDYKSLWLIFHSKVESWFRRFVNTSVFSYWKLDIIMAILILEEAK